MAGKQRDVKVTFQPHEDVGVKLYVLSFSGEEGISQLYRVELNLAADAKKSIDFSKLVGKSGVLTLENDQGTRYLHGMICRFQQRHRDRNWMVYSATLVPRAWRLNHKRDSRTFQKKNLQQIVEEVLKAAKVDHQFRLKGNKKPPKRTFCVQYRETDWNFVCRLLEEEGFHYYFEHQKSKHVMHISNDATFHPPISETDDELAYHLASTAPKEEAIFSLFYEERVRTGKVSLSDFTFLKPALDQKKKDKDGATEDRDLELYDYPGLYPFPDEHEKGDSQELQRKKEHTEAMPDMRLEALQGQRKVGTGRSDSLRLTSGYAFTLDGYDRKDLNKKPYLLLRVTHVGEKHGDLEAGAVSSRIRYHNSFTMMPKAVPYRPPRVAPKPYISGSQTATVVGPSGDEIYTDKHRRVKIQFHWDRKGERNEKSSCWVRVSQLWAGEGWGSLFTPRIDQEVIVNFLEGDPDRPIIIGRVYHATNTPPYNTSDDKTKSTIKSNSTLGGGGYNEICFEDNKGKEQIITHAQRDQNETVRRNMTTSVGNDQKTTVKKNRTTIVEDENDKLDVKTGRQDITIKAGAKLTVQAGTREVSVTGGDYKVGVEGGSIIGVASKSVSFDGKSEGTLIKGKGGEGVRIDGEGTVGVCLTGKDSVWASGKHVLCTGDEDATLFSKATLVQGTTKVDVMGPEVIITGTTKVTIDGGGSKVEMSADGIKVTGTTVKIN